MSKNSSIISAFKDRKLWLHIGLMIFSFFILLFVLKVWLEAYTRHGQKIKTPSYIGEQFELAKIHSDRNDFDLIVTDSVFLVGQDGGKIIRQVPAPNKEIKEGRKIYVAITKHDADMIQLDQLPMLYGKDYHRKKKELDHGYEINAKIAGYQFDPGPADHILMAMLQNDTILTRTGRKKNIEIEKGGTIQFVLSKKQGGFLDVPNLLCKTYDEVKFLLDNYNLNIQLIEDGGVLDLSSSIIWKQSPAYSPNGIIEMGSSIEVYIMQDKPPFCE